MWRQYRSLGLALVALSLVSCVRTGSDDKMSATGVSAAQAKSTDRLVTQSPVEAQAERDSPMMVLAPPPPPPPAPGMYTRQAWSPPYHDVGRDKFTSVDENAFKIVREAPVSTFSIDVDTASYSWVRASLNENLLPQPASVRTEEMVNYFPYDYAPPRTREQPFSTNVAVYPSPWSPGRKLVRIGIRGYSVSKAERPHSNLVFLIDTSGSMQEPNKLPLVKQSLEMLLDELAPSDTVAIVTYAGYAGTALEPTKVRDKAKIEAVIDGLGAGGSTAGAEGIRQAYALAEANLDPNGVNRVILSTDGDFNVGITDQEELKNYVEREREKGVFLSVLGYGIGITMTR